MSISVQKSPASRIAGQIALLTVLSVFSSATPAGAGTCLDQVTEIADSHAVSIDPPDLDRAPPADALSRSGGVIEPPATSDRAVIEPPATGSAMPTLPDVEPTAPRDEVEAGVTLTAADTVILQSLLVAARAEAERGDEEGCFKRLGDARDFLRTARTE